MADFAIWGTAIESGLRWAEGAFMAAYTHNRESANDAVLESSPVGSGIEKLMDFSRDGKWVVYVSNQDATLWRSRVDGSERLQLTYKPVSAFLLHWSPYGTQTFATYLRLVARLSETI